MDRTALVVSKSTFQEHQNIAGVPCSSRIFADSNLGRTEGLANRYSYESSIFSTDEACISLNLDIKGIRSSHRSTVVSNEFRDLTLIINKGRTEYKKWRLASAAGVSNSLQKYNDLG